LSSTTATLPLGFGFDLGDPDLGSLVVVEHKLAEDDVVNGIRILDLAHFP
jgi:hypothetical protein